MHYRRTAFYLWSQWGGRGIRDFVINQIKPYVDHLEIDYYGNVLAQVKKGDGGHRVHRNRWKAVEGGSSDTRIWAEQGMNSINLSAGYLNEHTSSETLDIEANYGTYEFVTQLIEESPSLMNANLNRKIRTQSKVG